MLLCENNCNKFKVLYAYHKEEAKGKKAVGKEEIKILSLILYV